MLKHGLKLLLCSFVLFLGVLSTMVNAKDFQYFSLDIGPQWQATSEPLDNTDISESVVLTHTQKLAIASVSAQDMGKPVTMDMFKDYSKNYFKDAESSMQVKKYSVDESKGEAVYVGTAADGPFEAYFKYKGNVIICFFTFGEAIKDSMSMYDSLRIK